MKTKTVETVETVETVLIRAEYASLAISDTWDHYRARRLAKLIKHYGDRAQFAVMADRDVDPATYRTGFQVAAMGPTAARTARTIARSNGIDVSEEWRYPLS